MLKYIIDFVLFMDYDWTEVGCVEVVVVVIVVVVVVVVVGNGCGVICGDVIGCCGDVTFCCGGC